MLSLGGIPLTGGFLGKLYLVRAAWTAGGPLLVPAIFIAITSVVGLGYYLRVVSALYMEPEAEKAAAPFASRALAAVTLATSLAIVIFGVWPQPLLRWLTG